MAISLQSIKRSVLAPPRVVIYGVPGIGKTTLAASAPAPIFMPIEDGLGQLDVPTFPQPKSLTEVYECIGALLNEKHDYQTIVLDSLDKLEPLIWEHVCATVPAGAGKPAARIEDYGYGKGYVHALSEWRTLLNGLDALRDSGMIVCSIAHSAVVKFEPPDSDTYDRYQMRLHKSADAAICDWADVLLFANYDVKLVARGDDKKRAIGEGKRTLHTTERAAWRAKNRYRMPDTLPMEWAAIEQYFVPRAAQNNDPTTN